MPAVTIPEPNPVLAGTDVMLDTDRERRRGFIRLVSATLSELYGLRDTDKYATGSDDLFSNCEDG